MGQGTTFTVVLPVEAHRAGGSAPASVTASPRSNAKSLLVVEDEADVASILVEALARDGHHVEIACNGVEALEKLSNRTYDLVLSDTRMPVMDGESFYAEMRRRFPTLRSRIIFLTGDVLNNEKRAFLERVGAPCLSKPYDLIEVRALVHRMLSDAAA